MRKLIMILILFLLLSTSHIFSAPIQSQPQSFIPSIDLPIPTPLPKNFRLLTKEFPPSPYAHPSREGLESMRISASGQFTTTSLYFMLEKIPANKKVVIVDLREESHGFINGIPISWKLADNTTWTNIGKQLGQIQLDEITRLQELIKNKSVILDPYTDPLNLNVSEVATEKEIVRSLGLEYLRIPITENHKPQDRQVDVMVQLILNLPEDVWLHVHCHGGRGRTTTFLIIYDILLNGRNVTFDDILLRQNLIGGTDMRKKVPDEEQRKEPIAERLQFLEDFYQYRNEVDPSQVPFSEWKKGRR